MSKHSLKEQKRERYMSEQKKALGDRAEELNQRREQKKTKIHSLQMHRERQAQAEATRQVRDLEERQAKMQMLHGEGREQARLREKEDQQRRVLI